MRFGAAGLAVALCAGGTARGIDEALLRAAPAGSCVVYFLDGAGQAKPQGGDDSGLLGMASFLIDRAHDFGLLSALPESTRTTLDVIASLPAVLEHAHTVMLLEARAEVRRGDSHRLGSLRAAVVVHTRGDNARIEQRIQHLLKAYANTEDSTLSTESPDGETIYRLRDRRLAEWVELSWGRVDDYYVLALGTDVMESVIKSLRGSAPRLAEEDWFRKSWQEVNGKAASFAVHLQFDRLRDVGEGSMARKVDTALREAGWPGAQRGLWTVGRRERAVVSRGVVLRNGKSEIHRITTDGPLSDDVRRAVPDEATWYATLEMPPRNVILSIAAGYLAMRSPKNQERIASYWRDVQSRAGVSIEEDLLPRLQPPWIIHDYPRHALNLPLAWTRMVKIDGDTEVFRSKLDRLMESVRDTMDPERVARLRRDDDGVWRLQLGLDGPALAVAEGYLILSFSSQAVRQNIARLRAAPAQTGPAMPKP